MSENVDGFLKKITKDIIKKYDLQDNLTRYLVKKKRRGTFQAFEESGVTQKEIEKSTEEFINNWIKEEILHGSIKEMIEKEIKNQILLELSSRGFIGVFKDIT